MFSVGVDIVEISRFKKARFLSRLAEFFLTPTELIEAQKKNFEFQLLASRFAVKEAVIKALPEPIEFNEFEIVKKAGKPEVRFIGDKFSKYKVAISLSHSLESAIGFAMVEF